MPSKIAPMTLPENSGFNTAILFTVMVNKILETIINMAVAKSLNGTYLTVIFSFIGSSSVLDIFFK